MKHIFVIDDDLVLQRIMRKMLSNYSDQIQVECYDDGKLGIEGLSNAEVAPDLIFLDINMPEMDAWQFIEAYKKLDVRQDIPIYILSSSIDQRDIDKAMEIGLVKKYLIKPMKKQDLHMICDIELGLKDSLSNS